MSRVDCECGDIFCEITITLAERLAIYTQLTMKNHEICTIVMGGKFSFCMYAEDGLSRKYDGNASIDCLPGCTTDCNEFCDPRKFLWNWFEFLTLNEKKKFNHAHKMNIIR